MIRPDQEIRIWSIQRREGRAKPHIARWVVADRKHSRAFRTRAQADRHRSKLMVAQQAGERFDPYTGQPESWAPAGASLTVYAWARQWLAEEWAEWAPRTRKSAVESMARLVPLAVSGSAPDPPVNLRRHLTSALAPQATAVAGPEEAWLGRWGLTLGELDEKVLADVDRQLGLGDRGQTLAANTAARYRREARSCIRRAVELKLISADPWPPARRGRSTRKSRRQSRAIDTKRLPDPPTNKKLIAAMRNHQPASCMYQTMTAVSYYAGLRPSEVVMLRAGSIALRPNGWGQLDVVEADDGFDVSAQPKTGRPSVPIPPVLVDHLDSWQASRGMDSGSLLLRRPLVRYLAWFSAAVPKHFTGMKSALSAPPRSTATRKLAMGLPLGVC